MGSQAGAFAPADAVGHLGYTGCSIWIDPVREISVILLDQPRRVRERRKEASALRARIHDAIWKEIAG